MAWIQKALDTTAKLTILSQDSQYDLACACGMNAADRRRRSKEDTWVYPVATPNRGKTFLFKTLLSNVCVNDCKYCPLRAGRDPQRCTLTPEELAQTFLDYYQARRVMGLFVSSGVIGSPDATMERINRTAAILRQKQFKGYLHLKIIPGASDAAIAEAVALASSVSVNIETPGAQSFQKLCTRKDYLADIIRPMKLISQLTAKGTPHRRVRQTTQFVVGAADETDREIVKYVGGLYQRLELDRIYFSAYQRGLGEPDLPGEQTARPNREMLLREHRLYQVDWLIRKYGFQAEEILFEADGNLSLTTDPKEMWAKTHPECFPVNLNTASKAELLRIPGFGPMTVQSILAWRKDRRQIHALADLGKPGKRLAKAAGYIRFS